MSAEGPSTSLRAFARGPEDEDETCFRKLRRSGCAAGRCGAAPGTGRAPSGAATGGAGYSASLHDAYCGGEMAMNRQTLRLRKETWPHPGDIATGLPDDADWSIR